MGQQRGGKGIRRGVDVGMSANSHVKPAADAIPGALGDSQAAGGSPATPGGHGALKAAETEGK